jgi:predicted nuclease of predicted toxin-antitoxin system
MRILLDECLDWRLGRLLVDHHCVSVSLMGWSGLTNGYLLQQAEQNFDVFLTSDSNLTFQNLAKFDLAIILLEAKSTRLRDTAPLMPEVLRALRTIQPREVVRIGPAKEV